MPPCTPLHRLSVQSLRWGCRYLFPITEVGNCTQRQRVSCKGFCLPPPHPPHRRGFEGTGRTETSVLPWSSNVNGNSSMNDKRCLYVTAFQINDCDTCLRNSQRYLPTKSSHPTADMALCGHPALLCADQHGMHSIMRGNSRTGTGSEMNFASGWSENARLHSISQRRCVQLVYRKRKT